jgi:hypothetical protein
MQAPSRPAAPSGSRRRAASAAWPPEIRFWPTVIFKLWPASCVPPKW